MITSIEAFIEYLQYEKNYSSHTISAYERDLDEFQTFVLNRSFEFDVTLIDSDIVRDWIGSLSRHGYSHSSINRKLSSVKSFFKFLHKRGTINRNTVARVVGPKIPQRLPHFIKEKEMDQLFDSGMFDMEEWIDSRDFLILYILYVTGMRRSELANLKDSDIDMDRDAIKVFGKRSKERIIPFASELKQLIVQYQDIRSLIMGDTEFLLCNTKGEQLSPDRIYQIVRLHLGKVTTAEKRGAHILRHTFATAMLNNGAELRAIKELLGHESLSSTEVYTHNSIEEIKKMYNQAHPRAEKK